MMKIIPEEKQESIRRRFHFLYGEQAEALVRRFYHLVGRYGVGAEPPLERQPVLWDHRDVMLITYADMVKHPGEVPLRSLGRFCVDHLKGAVSTVHLLPFYPWTSDDGFSVKDYREVKAEYGKWDDITRLGRDFGLAFDLVLNHCSVGSSWFRDFLLGIAPGRHYFLEMDPKTDLSQVFRPRTSPLLTKTTTRYGESWVWTTFSADQVDLNWQNPDLLFEFLDILFLYLSKGVRILRLDAVAFCWKEAGSSCVHLPQTHELVKLLRDVCAVVAPGTLLLTETNVPHADNISYFGEGDEAHMVYNFSLPPLVLHALLTGNGSHLTAWARDLAYPGSACTFLNFTASHDGIGVGPLRGILPESEIQRLALEVEKRGGQVSSKSNPDGSLSPYELNITYASALADPGSPDVPGERFFCSQGIALAMRGVPAVYFHSLMGTPNDYEGMHETGRARTINRRKYRDEELRSLVAEQDEPSGNLFRRYTQLLRRRANHRAFHPDGEQRIHDIGDAFFCVERISPNAAQKIFCVFNLTGVEQVLTNPANSETLRKVRKFYDIVSGKTYSNGKKGITIAPWQFVWLVPREEG